MVIILFDESNPGGVDGQEWLAGDVTSRTNSRILVKYPSDRRYASESK